MKRNQNLLIVYCFFFLLQAIITVQDWCTDTHHYGTPHTSSPILHYAIIEHDINTLCKHITPALLDRQDEYGNTPLHTAFYAHNGTAVHTLISYGASLAIANNNGNFPLHLAISVYNDGEIDILSPSQINRKHGNTIIERLINTGASCDTPNIYGDTPMHMAARHSHVRIVELLIRNHADLNVKNDRNISPFYLCVKRNDPRLIVTCVYYGAHINSKHKHGKTPLHCATENASYETTKTLLSHGATINTYDNYKQTPLHKAAARLPVLVDLLLHNGASIHVDTQDAEGKTPLHYIPMRWHNGSATTELLLEYGALPDIRDRYDMRPLDYAIQAINPLVVNLLLNSGAATTEAHILLLHRVIQTICHVLPEHDKYIIAADLIKHGAAITNLDAAGNTPLHEAVRNNCNDIVYLLLHNGAPITSRNKNQHKPYMLTDNAETLRMLTAASAATSTLQKSNVQRSSEVYNHKNTTRSSNRAQIRTIRNTLKQYPDLEDMILSRIIHSSPDAYTIFHDLGFSDAKYMRCAVHGNSTHAIKHFANSATNKHILTPWVLHTIRDSNHVALRNLVHTLQGNTICKTCVIPAIYHNDTEAVAIMAHYISYTSSVSNTNVSREGLLSILKHDYRYNYAKRNNKRLCGRILYRHLRDNILAHTSAISDRKPDGTIPEYDTLNGHLRRLPRDIYFYIQDFLPLSTLLMHNSDI